MLALELHLSELLAECKPCHSSKPVLLCDNAIQPTPVLMMVCRRRRLSSSTKNDIPPLCPERRSNASSPGKRASSQSSLLQSPKQRGRTALSDESRPLQSNVYDRLNHSDDLQTRTSSPKQEDGPRCRWRSVESLHKIELALPSSPRRIKDEDSTKLTKGSTSMPSIPRRKSELPPSLLQQQPSSTPSLSARERATTRKKTSYGSRAA